MVTVERDGLATDPVGVRVLSTRDGFPGGEVAATVHNHQTPKALFITHLLTNTYHRILVIMYLLSCSNNLFY